MITTIAGLLLSWGVPARFARAIVWGAIIASLIGCLALAKCGYDRRTIAAHDTARDLELSDGARAADGNAATARVEDTARLSTESVSLNEVIANAPPPPEPASLSDARRAYYECIRVQQAARASGRPAPAC